MFDRASRRLVRGRNFYASCSNEKQFEEGRALLQTSGGPGARLTRHGAEVYALCDLRRWVQVTDHRMGCWSMRDLRSRVIILTGRQKIRAHFVVFGEAAEVTPDGSTPAVCRIGEISLASRNLSGSPDCLRVQGNRHPPIIEKRIENALDAGRG